MRTDHFEIIAAAADLNIQARFQQTQVLVQRTAQIRQPRIVGRLEIEFPL
jgi:hypothetical protein